MADESVEILPDPPIEDVRAVVKVDGWPEDEDLFAVDTASFIHLWKEAMKAVAADAQAAADRAALVRSRTAQSARRDAAVEAEIRRSVSSPRAQAGSRGTKLEDWSYADQQRIKKGLRPLGKPGRRPEPKAEETPLERLRRKAGLGG